MLKKVRNICTILCMIFAVNVPMSVQAGGEELVINSYDILKEVLETDMEEEYMDYYLEPDNFTWPEEEITLKITDNLPIASGTWNIPKNVTIEFPARKASWNSEEESNLEVAGKVIIDSDHSISHVDIVIEKSGCIEGKDYTSLYVGENETLTLRDGAILDCYLRLDGTLTGEGVVTKRVNVSAGYNGKDANAVISGNVRILGGIDVGQNSNSEYNSILTIPSGSNIEVDSSNSECGLSIGTNGKICLSGELSVLGRSHNIHGGNLVMNEGKLTIKPGAWFSHGYVEEGKEKGKILGTGTIYMEANKDANGMDQELPSLFYYSADMILSPEILEELSKYIDDGVDITTNAAQVCYRHDWSSTRKEPTYEEAGEVVSTCLRCGKTEIHILDKLEPDTSQSSSKKPPKKGTILTHKSSKGKYVVSSTSKANPAVSYKETTTKKAKTVTIPATITVKGITYKVTAIADNAFKNNKKVTKVTVGKNITQIGKNTFYGCKNLKNIVIKSTKLKKVEKNIFKGINAKAKIEVPSKKLSDYKKLLKGKGQGKKVKIIK